MTLDVLHIVLLVAAVLGAGAALWLGLKGKPDTASLSAELSREREERAAMKAERDEQRTRAETAERSETGALAKLEAAERKVAEERQASGALLEQLSALRAEHGKTVADVAAIRERTQFADEAIKNMKDAFALQSTEAMRVVLSDLRKAEADAREQREKAESDRLGAQLKPVADTLERFEKHVNELEQKRASDAGGLKAQIEILMQASKATQDEARKLSSALRRGAGVQGRWGEQTLRNVLELAGLASRFDFQEQFQVDGEARLRPDVVVQLAGGGMFVVDAKCSLTAYLEAQDALDDQAREAALTRHAASLRNHISNLSGKEYWDQFKGTKSPDFVALFVPGDSFFAAALDRLPDLMTQAMDKRVLIVTPTTLFGLCKAVAYGWRVEEQAKNADEVALLGRDLYKRLAVMGGYVKAVGSALDGAVDKYNQFIGSLDSQVLTQARKFEDLKVDHEAKEIPDLTPIENRTRISTKLATDEATGRPQVAGSRSSTPLLDLTAAEPDKALAGLRPKSVK